MNKIQELYYKFIGFTYEQEFMLYFLFILIPIIIWYVVTYNSQHANVKVSSTHDYAFKTSTILPYISHIPFLCKIIALLFFILALARPVTYDNFSNTTSYGVDIVLAMDVSSSMLEEDLHPNRIEAAKDVAASFINTRQSDRIGIVAFSGESFTQSPLTTDHATLLNLIGELECGMIEDGTAIGLGIASGVSRLKDSKAISKVIVLLTDGENNKGDIAPMTAAELAKKYGIRIYTIGVGSNRSSNMFYRSNLDEKTLRKIAQTTDGEYFRAKNKRELFNIYDKIDSLEKTKIEDFKHTRKNEEYWYFVLIGLGFLLCDILLRLTVLKRFP